MALTHTAGQSPLSFASPTALERQVIQALPTIGSLSLSDLATITGAHPDALEPYLGAAVASGFLVQRPNGEYEHSRESLALTPGGQMLLPMCDGWCSEESGCAEESQTVTVKVKLSREEARFSACCESNVRKVSIVTR